MTEAIATLMLAVEYAGDMLICIGAVTFLVLLKIDHGIN